MNRIDKKRLASHFGRRVQSYDQVTPVQERMASTLVSQAATRLAGHPVKRVLELGCGTGRMTRQLTKAFPDAAITAVDISPEMIAHARSAVAGVDFYVADAEAFIRAASEPYNLVISNAAVQWFEDARASLIGARALLAHDGLLVVSTFGDRTFHELRHAFDAAYAVAEMELEQHVVLMNTPTYWREVFPECEVLEEISTRGFASVAAFLHSIQEAGAVNSTAGPHFLSRRILREMIDQYSKRYADPNRGGITATYHIVYLYCHAESNGKPP